MVSRRDIAELVCRLKENETDGSSVSEGVDNILSLKVGHGSSQLLLLGRQAQEHGLDTDTRHIWLAGSGACLRRSSRKFCALYSAVVSSRGVDFPTAQGRRYVENCQALL